MVSPEFDSFRLPNIANLDLRVAKDIARPGRTVLNLSIDAFNVLNQHTVLGRDGYLSLGADGTDPAYNRITSLMSPRVLRFGARIKF